MPCSPIGAPESLRQAPLLPAMAWSPADFPDLSGKIALVTGGSTGLGYEAAKELALHNAAVYVTARTQARAEKYVFMGRLHAELPDFALEMIDTCFYWPELLHRSGIPQGGRMSMALSWIWPHSGRLLRTPLTAD